jgi:hypothetical protein
VSAFSPPEGGLDFEALVPPLCGWCHGSHTCAERAVETQYGWNSLVNVLFPSWRLEPLGAEGQLGSMAAGNRLMLPPLAEGTQVESQVVLHRSNREVLQAEPVANAAFAPVLRRKFLGGKVRLEVAEKLIFRTSDAKSP